MPRHRQNSKLKAAVFTGTRFTYAIGRLALWSSDPKLIAGDGKAALTASDVRHVAIAKPELAPYGVAAKETLEKLGLWETIQDKIVMGENIGQTHSMVETGNAQLGFVALSAVFKPGATTQGVGGMFRRICSRCFVKTLSC